VRHLRPAPSRPVWLQRTTAGSICALLAVLGRRSCGAGVVGWLNATVPLHVPDRTAAALRAKEAGLGTPPIR
jgi:hypothetical protein